jgi:peptidyl-prolyl cis-trans isomerase D
MLKLMRDSFQQLKWVLFLIIFVFIVLVFVDWGGAGRTSGSTTDLGAAAARVNGDTVSMAEYRRALYFAEQRFEQLYGQKLTDDMRKTLRLEEQVLNDLVNQALLLQQAEEMNLAATEDEIRKAIFEIPVLNPDGKFVGSELYERYILGMGYAAVADYEREVARDLTLAKIRSALANSIAIPAGEAEAEYRRQNESARIRYAYLSVDNLTEPVEVSPEEVSAFYGAHANRYSHPAQRRVKFLIADLAQVRAGMTFDDAELQAYYEQSKESYRTGESVRASHILIPLAPDADPQTVETARVRASTLVEEIRNGADFAERARQVSADPGSAAQGGDVGFFARGEMVPEFEEAAFGLSIGQVSEPVRTQYGFHILKVTEKRDAGYKPLDEVRSDVITKLTDRKVEEVARDSVAAARARVEKDKPSDDAGLRAIADAFPNVALNDTQWFGRDGSIFGVGRSDELSSWAFAAKEGDISAVISTQRGPIVGWLAGSREAGVSELSEVRARVEADARREKAAKVAADRLAGAMPADSIDDLAGKFELTVEEATLTRGGSVPNVPGDAEPLIDAALQGEVGAIAGPVAMDQGAVVLLIEDQQKFDPEVYAREKEQFIDTMRQREAARLVGSMLDKLRADSDVVLNVQLAGTTPGV